MPFNDKLATRGIIGFAAVGLVAGVLGGCFKNEAKAHKADAPAAVASAPVATPAKPFPAGVVIRGGALPPAAPEVVPPKDFKFIVEDDSRVNAAKDPAAGDPPHIALFKDQAVLYVPLAYARSLPKGDLERLFDVAAKQGIGAHIVPAANENFYPNPQDTRAIALPLTIWGAKGTDRPFIIHAMRDAFVEANKADGGEFKLGSIFVITNNTVDGPRKGLVDYTYINTAEKGMPPLSQLALVR